MWFKDIRLCLKFVPGFLLSHLHPFSTFSQVLSLLLPVSVSLHTHQQRQLSVASGWSRAHRGAETLSVSLELCSLTEVSVWSRTQPAEATLHRSLFTWTWTQHGFQLTSQLSTKRGVTLWRSRDFWCLRWCRLVQCSKEKLECGHTERL